MSPSGHRRHAAEEAACLVPSRSQRKRDSLALQRVGEALTRCSDAALAGLPLSDALRQAVTDWKRIPSREGKRRQLQYIGRLMRKEEESEALIAALGGGDAA